MMVMATAKRVRSAECGVRSDAAANVPRSALRDPQSGMTLFAVLAIMTVFAIGLLAVAPTVQIEVQREEEVEAIRRGEEVAEAIRRYVLYYQGNKLPESMDDLLEGLPRGTKQVQILRPSAAIDPLSEDGKWRLIAADVDSIGGFARRVQNYNGGLLPNNSDRVLDRYSIVLVNSLRSDIDDDGEPDDFDDNFDVVTDNQPFIGVASQSKSKSVISYYGMENHSRWIFTPLFRGTGRTFGPQIQPTRQPPRPPGLTPGVR
jgi:type II secretory pathway pseudopilin PulG